MNLGTLLASSIFWIFCSSHEAFCMMALWSRRLTSFSSFVLILFAIVIGELPSSVTSDFSSSSSDFTFSFELSSFSSFSSPASFFLFPSPLFASSSSDPSFISKSLFILSISNSLFVSSSFAFLPECVHVAVVVRFVFVDSRWHWLFCF